MNKVMVFKITDGEGSEVYLENTDNVFSILSGFVEWAEPNQTMTLETVLVTRLELQKLPRGFK